MARLIIYDIRSGEEVGTVATLPDGGGLDVQGNDLVREIAGQPIHRLDEVIYPSEGDRFLRALVARLYGSSIRATLLT